LIERYHAENADKPKKRIKHKHIPVIATVREEFVRVSSKKLQYFYRRLYAKREPVAEIKKVASTKVKVVVKKKNKIQLSSMLKLNEDYFRFVDGIYVSY